ncbi:MAG: hypothetical protein WA090_05425 [Candidatus Nanopelagicaceae bacterium]
MIVARAFFTGLALGTIARLWMRWISTDPEFTWSGTIFIVGAFTIFFTAQSLVLVLRGSTSSRRRSGILRAGGLVFTLPIFTAAGGIMFPTVALASFALWGGILQKRGRVFSLALSLIIPIIISKDIVVDFGWTFATVGRILLFFSIYTLVIFATRPTLSPSQRSGEERKGSLSRKQKVMISVGILVVVALLRLFMFGISGD